MVCRQLEDLLQRHDVRPIEALGLPLDPNLHEAVGAQPTDEYPPHAIVQELQKGYQMHDRVVRPSKVIVAQAPPAAQGGLDAQTEALNAGELTAEDAAESKWWCTELQKRAVDGCLQLFGGYGYMMEYPIARAYADARVQTIYGGTTEIMKEIIGRDIVGR